MITHALNKYFATSLRIAVISLFVISVSVVSGFSQDLPDPVPHLETLPAGTIIIPMDDAKQTASNGRFNLKAYGLVQRLLQNNIPVKWSIRAGKSKDAVDFTATAARVYPSAQNAASLDFSGGPFIIPTGYETIALQVIQQFRNERPPNDNGDAQAQDVAVYRTTTSTTGVDIRYTITHKPKIAIGQNTGITSGVHQKLYDFALINDYSNVSGSTINEDSCYTIATQPHFDEPAFISNFRHFLESGGNVLLQCLSITTFENVAAPIGRFQTTGGYDGVGNNTNIDTNVAYNNGDMPFSQFIGAMNDNQLGAVEDYKLKRFSNFQNGTFDVVKNTGNYDDYLVATESHITGPNANGGAVFALGGHDYFQNGTDTTSANYNAQRMILNALFVPVTRPAGCGLQVPVIYSYKSVRLTTDLNGNGLVSPGDTLTWTITYVNTTPIAFPDFQITDLLDAKVDFSPSLTVTTTGTGTTASANGSYNGTSNVNMLAPGARLDIGGKIQVTVKTTVKNNSIGQVWNQTNATGINVAATGVRSDALDANTQGVQGNPTLPPGSIPQPQQTSGIDPTLAQILIPTAADASISGRVVNANGVGVIGASIRVVNAATSETFNASTDASGRYSVGGLQVGNLYIISASHWANHFPVSSYTFMLNDNVSGLTFAADVSKGSEADGLPIFGGSRPSGVKSSPAPKVSRKLR
jgi:uncharacterized repeat protein (TIGR01451 family)